MFKSYRNVLKKSPKGDFFFLRGVGGSPPTPLTIKNQVVKGNVFEKKPVQRAKE